MNFLILSCKQATELVEKKQVTRLSLKENLRLKIHLSLCDACRSYEKQSYLLEQMLKRIIDATKGETKHLDAATKLKMLQRIKDSH